MNPETAPVLVGVAQRTWRDIDPREAPTPLDALEEVARAAAQDAGAGASLLGAVDTLGSVDLMGWRVRNPLRLLAERLGIHPRSELKTALGGETGLLLLNEMADRIRRGDSQVGLVTTTHNLKTRARADAAGIRLDWPEDAADAPLPATLNPAAPGTSERENHYGMVMPTVVYPMFGNALRAKRGLGLDEHRVAMGELFAPFTRAAAANPHAWFPVERSAQELVTPDAANRMIVFPYTKYLNAVLFTDQAAALLIVSEARARALGIDPARFVYWRGGASSVEEPWFVTERPDIASSPALRASVDVALEDAGCELGDVAAFDFYSCFPSAVEVACEMLGMKQDDPRGQTVCGGLPYAGGPGNGYTLHAAASMVERLRSRPGELGLCTGNGWYLTKHSSTLLGTQPPTRELCAPRKVSAPQQGRVELVEEASGSATVETYTVTYDREGAPERGVVVGRLDDGSRFLANTPADRALNEAFVAQEAIGRRGRVKAVGDRNVFEPS